MTRDRRDFIRLLGAAGLATAIAPAARVAALAAESRAEDVSTDQTALVIVDSYNDFLSEDGLTWGLLKLVGEKNDLVSHLLRLVAAARTSGTRIAFAPHHRYREGSFSDRKYLTPSQYQQVSSEAFAEGGFGGQFYEGLAPIAGDIVASQHTSSSGFTETDLHDQLAAAGISHVLVAGCISNTCIEATVRSAVDLGYHVTVVTDAIAAFSPADHELAIRTTLPLIAHRTVSTADAVEELQRAPARTGSGLARERMSGG